MPGFKKGEAVVISKAYLQEEREIKDQLRREITHLKSEIEGWKDLWVPYSMLPEEEKEKDRVWARRVLDILGEVKVLSKQERRDAARNAYRAIVDRADEAYAVVEGPAWAARIAVVDPAREAIRTALKAITEEED